MVEDADFYHPDPPTFLQQGDIIAGVPVLFPPPKDELFLLRTPQRRTPLQDLAPGVVEVVREKVLGDAFDQVEYAAAGVARAAAVLMTQTCDLADKDEYLVAPLEVLEGSGINEGNLRAGKFTTLHHVPSLRDYFGESYIDFTSLRPVGKESVQLKDRIAAMSAVAQEELSRRFARALGREWGHAPGDEVPETAKYRCILCVKYDVEVVQIQSKRGDKFPECPNCKRERKRAQWHQVLPLKKLR